MIPRNKFGQIPYVRNPVELKQSNIKVDLHTCIKFSTLLKSLVSFFSL